MVCAKKKQPLILTGTVGGVYAGGVCTAAALRDKDDYKNASIGGALAGSIFGIKSQFIYRSESRQGQVHI